MITALLGALSLSAVKPSDPPIRITLNSDGYYERGDRAKVRLRVADDGYVVVLRVDADGRVRVLYPLDPGDDNFVRGGHDFELRGRGDRETFFVDDASGDGTVMGAWSARPFHFERYVRGDHWDYRVLAGNDQMKDDAESGLVDLVSDMASGEHFEYDVARYSVGGDNDRSYRTRYYSTNYYDPFYNDPWYDPWYYGSGLHIGIGFGFGYPYRYRPWYYDPFYDPFFYDPFYYSGYGYYRPRGYGFSSFCWGDPFCYGYAGYRTSRPLGGFAFKPRAVPPLVLPRQRTPFNTALGVSRREPQGGGWLNRGDPMGVMTRRRGGDTPRFDPMRPVERDGSRPDVGDRRRDDRPRDDQPNNAGDRRRDEPSRDSYRGRDKPSRGNDTPREARPSNGGDRGSSNSGRSSGGGGYRSSGGGGGGGGRSTPSSGGGSRSSGGSSRSSGGGSRPSNSSGGRRGGH
jgi:hypothetical protein